MKEKKKERNYQGKEENMQLVGKKGLKGKR